MKEIDINGPDPDVIEDLERLLEKAKSGEIQAIAYATVKQGAVTSCGWSGVDRMTTLLGALNLLRARIEMSSLRLHHPELFEDIS